MSNKIKPAAPAKGITTNKPELPAVVTSEPAKHIPRVPKINAGNVEYDEEKVLDVLANFDKLAEELPVKEKKGKTKNPDRNIARNIVAKLFPAIEKLIAKGYNKREMYDLFTAQGIKINFAGFSSAINRQIKAAEVAASNKLIEIELTDIIGDKATITSEGGGEPTAEELEVEEQRAESHVTI